MTTTARPGGTDLRVFLSYRRSDCQAQANGLHDGLVHRLPGASVFMDIDSIPYGVDFEKHIRSEITSCDVVLVLIGDDWLNTVNADGVRRLDDPDDFVRLEIENALATPSVRVVPVLVEGASMPRTGDLPPSIAPLARLNAIELSDRRWKADLKTLSEVVETMARPERTSAAILPRPAPSMQTPAPSAPVATPEAAQGMRRWMIALPVVSVGLGAWAPALWAAGKKDHDIQARKRLRLIALGLALLAVVGFVLVGSSPRDANDEATGVAANVGVVLLLIGMGIGTAVALRERHADVEAERRQVPPAWMQQAVASREAREQHRRIAAQDPRLAQANGVGRPDLARSFDDGGLLDLNSLPLEALVAHAGLSRQEAQAVVEARDRLGRLSSIDELVVHAGVDGPSAERLRDYAVFL